MKKIKNSLTTIVFCFLLLISSFFSLQTVGAQIKRPILETLSPEDDYAYGVNIISPNNITYSSNSVLLNIVLKRPVTPSDYNFEILYSLNAESNSTIPSTTTFYDKSVPGITFSFIASYTLATGAVVLSNLSQGSYQLTVYGIYEHKGPTAGTHWPALMSDIQSLNFTINDGVPPSLKTIQVETFKRNLQLGFSVDEPISWIGYSLDDSTNVTFSGNTTLNGLAYGTHTLMVYANDTMGNMGMTGNISFIIQNPQGPSVPISVMEIGLTIAILGSISGVIWVYQKRSKKSGSGHFGTRMKKFTKSC